MRRSSILVFLFFLSSVAWAQHQGIGIRLGDPTGITYKNYFSNSRHAFEVGLGSVAPEWGHSYYKNSFHNHSKYSQDRYLSHNLVRVMYLQGRYLIHTPLRIDEIEGSFDWYWGVGGLLKLAKVDYRYEESGTLLQRRESITDVDFGPEVPLGLEYTFEDVPVTLFGEVSMFVELTDQPGVQLKGAFGIRYNFYGKL